MSAAPMRAGMKPSAPFNSGTDMQQQYRKWKVDEKTPNDRSNHFTRLEAQHGQAVA
jgi:hypothetical protein